MFALSSIAGAGGAVGAEDHDLVRRFVRTGAPDAFEELVRRHRGRVFRLAVSVLGPGAEAEAEEIAQDAFVRAYEKLATFRGESRFATWLYRITFRIAVDRRRTARWRNPHVGVETLLSLSTTAADPEASVLSRAALDRLSQAVDGLPDPWRAAVHLHYWLGRSVADIAEALAVRPNTVKSYLFRARKRLAAKIGESAP